MDNDDSISAINIKPEKVLKQLKNLNVSKSCSPDSCHPYFLRECAEEICPVFVCLFVCFFFCFFCFFFFFFVLFFLVFCKSLFTGDIP